MRPIPLKLRKELSNDPFMEKCIYPNCTNAPEWEHAFIYSGRQVNEKWAIVPCCAYHHRGRGLDKQYNKYVAYIRITKISSFQEVLQKYPRKDWEIEYKSLKKIYEVYK